MRVGSEMNTKMKESGTEVPSPTDTEVGRRTNRADSRTTLSTMPQEEEEVTNLLEKG